MLRAIVRRTVLWVVLPLVLFMAITPTETRSASCLVPIGKDQKLGRVDAFHVDRDGTLLIGAFKGLFRRDGDNLVPIGKDQDSGPIWVFHRAIDGTLLIGASKGLFRRAGANLVPVGKDQTIDVVQAFHEHRDGTLIVTHKGVCFAAMATTLF